MVDFIAILIAILILIKTLYANSLKVNPSKADKKKQLLVSARSIHIFHKVLSMAGVAPGLFQK